MARGNDAVVTSGRADFRTTEAAQKIILEHRVAGDPLPGQPSEQLVAAAKLAFKADPELARAWMDAPGES